MSPIDRIRNSFALALLATIAVGLGNRAAADALPVVTGVELQPLSAQVKRVAESLELLGQPLDASSKGKLDRALQMTDEAAAVRAVQDVFDPLCLVGVNINPESRVKAAQGPAAARLAQHGWR